MKSILEEFSKLTGFPSIPVSPGGTARLCFENQMTIDIEDLPGKGIIVLGNPLAIDLTNTPLLIKALQENAPARTQSRPIFSLQDSELIIHIMIPEPEVSAQQLVIAVETLLQTIENWNHIIRDQAPPSKAAPSDEPATGQTASWQLRA